jgi:hypothetical protein
VTPARRSFFKLAAASSALAAPGVVLARQRHAARGETHID